MEYKEIGAGDAGEMAERLQGRKALRHGRRMF